MSERFPSSVLPKPAEPKNNGHESYSPKERLILNQIDNIDNPNQLATFCSENIDKLTTNLVNYILRPDMLSIHKVNKDYLHNFIRVFAEAGLLTPFHVDTLLTIDNISTIYKNDPFQLDKLIQVIANAGLLTSVHADALLTPKGISFYKNYPSQLYSFIQIFANAGLLTKVHADTLLTPEGLSVYKNNPGSLHILIKIFADAGLLTEDHADALLTPKGISVYKNNPRNLHLFIKVFADAALLTPQNITNIIKWVVQNPNLVAGVKDLNLHRQVENKEVLNEYARALIQYGYHNPGKTGSVFHIIVELQALLDNQDTDSQHGYVSQQNIIQLQNFAKSKDIQTVFNTGSMIASSIGFLGSDVELEFKSNTDEKNNYTPHPDFALARLGYNTVYAIKNWSSLEPLTITKKGQGGEILNSINVKPIAVDSNFYHVYYLTEDDMVVSICLDMSRTKDLLQEGQLAFGEIAHYFDNSLDEGETNLSEHSSVSQFQDYLVSSYPAISEYIPNQGRELTWKQLLQIIENSQSSIFDEFPESYKALHWHITNEISLLTKEEFTQTNQALIRLMASKDHDNYFKICQSLLSGPSKVLAGDELSNSHSFVFYDKMEKIKANLNTEEVTEPFVRLYEARDKGFVDYYYQFDMETTTPSQMIVQGKDLFEHNPSLDISIKMAFEKDQSISINGVILNQEDFSQYKINPGDHVRVS